MKYLALILSIGISSAYASAQSKDTIQPNVSVRDGVNQECFRLYPTENIFTFLKLDTRDGTISQVQWSHEESSRFESFLNILPLVNEEEQVVNRFTLHPTRNNWTFILLDQINGKTWQVQWSTEYGERLILPINF